jgi:hypothetical protein
MNRRIAGLLAALALAAAAPASSATADSHAAAVVAAKSCSSGFVHANLPWGQKCLRRGEFCKRRWHGHSADHYYHRYGFHCHGSGRLT